MAFPGNFGFPGMGGGFPGMGGGYPGLGGGFPGFPGMGGGYPGMGGGGGGGLGPIEPYLNPTLRCLGATGQPIKLTIDTGAQTSMITLSAFQRHFPRSAIDRSKQMSITGIGGGTQQCVGRFTMVLTVPAPNGQRLQVEGECWIAPQEMMCEVLLGMPFLKRNEMHLSWEGGDWVEIRGTKVPIVMLDGNQ